MADDATVEMRSTCLNCGFEAASGSDDWGTVRHPSLGALTRCPDCGSTNITTR